MAYKFDMDDNCDKMTNESSFFWKQNELSTVS